MLQCSIRQIGHSKSKCSQSPTISGSEIAVICSEPTTSGRLSNRHNTHSIHRQPWLSKRFERRCVWPYLNRLTRQLRQSASHDNRPRTDLLESTTRDKIDSNDSLLGPTVPQSQPCCTLSSCCPSPSAICLLLTLLSLQRPTAPATVSNSDAVQWRLPQRPDGPHDRDQQHLVPPDWPRLPVPRR